MTGFTNWLRKILFLGPAKDRWTVSSQQDRECDPVRLKFSVRNAQQFGIFSDMAWVSISAYKPNILEAASASTILICRSSSNRLMQRLSLYTRLIQVQNVNTTSAKYFCSSMLSSLLEILDFTITCGQLSNCILPRLDTTLHTKTILTHMWGTQQNGLCRIRQYPIPTWFDDSRYLAEFVFWSDAMLLLLLAGCASIPLQCRSKCTARANCFNNKGWLWLFLSTPFLCTADYCLSYFSSFQIYWRLTRYRQVLQELRCWAIVCRPCCAMGMLKLERGPQRGTSPSLSHQESQDRGKSSTWRHSYPICCSSYVCTAAALEGPCGMQPKT